MEVPHLLFGLTHSVGAIGVSSSDEWIAVVSGLDIDATSSSDAQIQMLVEYLTGELGGPGDQISASQISRLIIAGNSFAPFGGGEQDGEEKKPVSVPLIHLNRVSNSVYSDDMATTRLHFLHIQQSTSPPTSSTWHALCLYTSYPGSLIHRERYSLNNPSHAPCLVPRLRTRHLRVRQTRHTSR